MDVGLWRLQMWPSTLAAAAAVLTAALTMIAEGSSGKPRIDCNHAAPVMSQPPVCGAQTSGYPLDTELPGSRPSRVCQTVFTLRSALLAWAGMVLHGGRRQPSRPAPDTCSLTDDATRSCCPPPGLEGGQVYRTRHQTRTVFCHLTPVLAVCAGFMGTS